MKIRGQILLASCGAALAAGAAAQAPAPVVPREQVYVSAEPVKRVAPDYPSVALQAGREGWARVSFIISESGEVIEPMIEDSSHHDFDAPTLRAIKQWRYQPATIGGKPVEQSMVQTIIRFQLEGSGGASSGYIKQYRAINDLIAAKKLTEAGPLLQALETGRLNFYEEAWLWWLKYLYLDATGTAEPSALEVPLRRALGSSPGANDDYLPPDVYVSASQRLFVVRARGGDFSGAVGAYESLRASKTAQRSKRYDETLAQLEPVRAEIMGLVNGPNILQQQARIEEHDYWVHRMLRRSFAIGDVQGGKIEVVDLRCTRTNRRYASLPADAVLTIPASWGDCGVYIKGDVGTSFTFEEYPAAAPANAGAPAPVTPPAQ